MIGDSYWRARASQDRVFARGQIELVIVELWPNAPGRIITKLESGADPTITTYERAAVLPHGLILPYDAAEPLRDALTEALGNRPDDYRAKYEESQAALEIERRRVDDLLATITGANR